MRRIKRASVIIGYPIFPEPVLDRPERDIACYADFSGTPRFARIRVFSYYAESRGHDFYVGPDEKNRESDDGGGGGRLPLRYHARALIARRHD